MVIPGAQFAFEVDRGLTGASLLFLGVVVSKLVIAFVPLRVAVLVILLSRRLKGLFHSVFAIRFVMNLLSIAAYRQQGFLDARQPKAPYLIDMDMRHGRQF